MHLGAKSVQSPKPCKLSGLPRLRLRGVSPDVQDVLRDNVLGNGKNSCLEEKLDVPLKTSDQLSRYVFILQRSSSVYEALPSRFSYFFILVNVIRIVILPLSIKILLAYNCRTD